MTDEIIYSVTGNPFVDTGQAVIAHLAHAGIWRRRAWFKSDRCGIETMYDTAGKATAYPFKSDRCGIVFIRALHCTKI